MHVWCMSLGGYIVEGMSWEKIVKIMKLLTLGPAGHMFLVLVMMPPANGTC
jgi:hypothetical protein